jgi:hypothetical protein
MHFFLGETHPSYNRSQQLSHSELEVTVPATIPRQLHIYLGKLIITENFNPFTPKK